MEKLSVGKMISDEALQTMPGLEYLCLFLDGERDAAVEYLGFFPYFAELRQYVRSTDRSMLSVDYCENHILINVEDDFNAIVRSQATPEALYDFWLQLLFIPEEQLDEDEKGIMGLRIGDIGNLPIVDYRKVMSKRYPISEPVKKFVMDTVSAVIPRGELDDDAMDRFVVTIAEKTGVDVEILDKSDLGLSVDEKPADGYCYTRIMPPSVATAAAAILGENPHMADVVALLLSCRYKDIELPSDFSYGLVGSGDKYHIVDGTEVVASMLPLMVNIVQKNPTAVLGTDVVEQLPIRGACDKCGFDDVKLVGHELRCRVPDPDAHIKKKMLREQSWLGDARHHADVREVLLRARHPTERLEQESQKYTAAEAQAEWYLAYKGKKIPPMGTSPHSIATAFEASYFSSFRDDYMKWLIDIYADCGVVDYLKPMYDEDKLYSAFCVQSSDDIVPVDDTSSLELLDINAVLGDKGDSYSSVAVAPCVFNAPSSHRDFPRHKPKKKVMVVSAKPGKGVKIQGDTAIQMHGTTTVNLVDYNLDGWHAVRLMPDTKVVLGGNHLWDCTEPSVLFMNGSVDIVLHGLTSSLQILGMDEDVDVTRVLEWQGSVSSIVRGKSDLRFWTDVQLFQLWKK